MEGANDVVRHIILRIIVDQAGFAESLAAAREKLKALKDSEGEINKARSKSAGDVTKALELQNKALDDNAKSHEAAQRAAQSGGRAAAEQTRAETDAIKEQTKQVEARTVAEAKAGQIDAQTRQKDLDAQRARSAARRKDADDEVARTTKNASDAEAARQKRLKSEQERAAARIKTADAHAAQVVKNEAAERAELIKTDALRSDLASGEKQRILDAQAARSAANKKAGAEVERLLADAAKVNAQANVIQSGAVNQRRISRDESTAKIARQDAASQGSTQRADENAKAARALTEERQKGVRQLNDQKAITQALTDLEKVAGAQADKRVKDARAANAENKNATDAQSRKNKLLTDEEKAREDIRKVAAATRLIDERSTEVVERRTRATTRQAERVAASTARADTTFKRARDPAEIVDKLHSQAIEEDQRRTKAAQPADTTYRQVRNADEALTRLHLQALSADEARTAVAERDAERRARAAEKEAERVAKAAERQAKAVEAARRRNPISAGVAGLAQNAVTAVGTALFAGPENTRLDNSIKSFQRVRAEGEGARKSVQAFFQMFTAGEHETASVFEHLTSRVRNFVKEMKPATSSGGGGNLLNNIFGNINQVSDGFSRVFDGMGKHLFSFQSLIVACIAALGPLAAILGAVGAAALGLASNIGALAGSLLALPGLIGAAVAGFGALAIVMKPLSNVFTAFTAAQKEAITTTSAATSAALSYKEALLQQQEAEIAYKRAQQDSPRLQVALNDARKQATRDIEDYRTALRKLKYDQEGADLGLRSAEEAQRRAAADPTASKLDRDIAAHNVQGALFDQQDQATQAKRTRQDAAEAFSKGVSGADAVVAAERAVEDQTYKIQEAYIAWQKSIIAVNKAAAESAAGGSAAAEYQKQLAKLPPETRKVATAIIDLIKNGGPFSKLRNLLSENIFGPVSKDTGRFKVLLGELGTFLTPASKAMGILADKILDLLTNPEWKDFLSRNGASSAVIIGNLGDAALSLADAFKGVVLAAQPFTEWVTGAIADVAKQFDGWANSVDADGSSPISRFLDITERRIKEIWPVVKNFVAGLGGFFAALNGGGGGEDFTTKINDGLLQMSETFRDLGEKAADPNSGFRQWLHNVLPLLGQIGHFLGAAGAAIGKLFSDPRNLHEAESLLHNLATKWLPQLAEIFSDLSDSGIISKLSAALGSVFGAVQLFLDHGGLEAFKVLATTLGIIASAIDYLVQHVPALGWAFGALATVIAVVLGGKLLTQIGLVIAKFSGLKALINGIASTLGSGFRIPNPGGSNNNKPGAASGTGTAAGTVSSAEGLALQRQMLAYLRQIAINTGGTGNIPDNTGGPDDDGKGGGKGKGGRHRAGQTVVKDAEQAAEDAAKGGGKGSWIKRLFRFGGNAVANDAGSVAVSAVTGGGLFSGIKNLFGGGGGSKPAASTAEHVAEDVAKTATRGGMAATIAKSAVKGLPALAATVAAEVGGTLLTNKFVKNDKDKASVNNALGTVASWAGTGALLGDLIPIPGVGPLAGGVIGGVAGGIKAYATDPNLRKFVNNKASTALHDTGEAFKNFGSSAVNMFTGGKDHQLGTAVAANTGLLGGLAAKTDIGKTIIDSLNKAGGKVSDFFTKTIPAAFHAGISPIASFFTKTIPNLFHTVVDTVGSFFTKTIPGLFHSAMRGIETFFTKTLPSLPGRAFDLFFITIGRLIRFFTKTLPDAAHYFFTQAVPHAAEAAWRFVRKDLWDPFLSFIRSIPGFFTKTIPHWFATARHWVAEHVTKPLLNFVASIPGFFTRTIPRWFNAAREFIANDVTKPLLGFIRGIPDFFTKTIPHWFASVGHWSNQHVVKPLHNFILGIPDFFTKTIPHWFETVPGWLHKHIVTPITNFFTKTLPNFFTQTLPNAISALPGVLYSNLVQPVLDFFGGLAGHIGDFLKGGFNWARGLFHRAGKDIAKGEAGHGHMSGGLIQGVYQGIEDSTRIRVTPGEMVIRRSKVEEPGAKAFLNDFNEHGMAAFYGGLSASVRPPVMSMVPPEATALTGAVPTVVNNTVNHAPLMGDVTINNPVRERSERSLRRQVQIAAIRHRR